MSVVDEGRPAAAASRDRKTQRRAAQAATGAADLDGYLCRPTDTIAAVMGRIDLNAGAAAIVVDAERRLLGTASDGDIRRGLLNGAGMDAPIEIVMNRAPRSGRFDTGRDAALAEMRRFEIVELPLLDTAGRVVGLHQRRALEVLESRTTPVVIMAGGRGRRLQPLTDDCPKPMLAVAGRPLLEITIDRLRKQGFRRVFIAVNYLADVIESYFGDGAAHGVEIAYLRENRPRGTAGALKLLPIAPQETVMVLNGDILTEASLARMADRHDKTGAALTVGLRQYEMQVPYGVVELADDRITGVEEKPTLRHPVSAGVYALAPRCWRFLGDAEEFDMPDVMTMLLQRNEIVKSHLIHEYWIDIGNKSDYEEANLISDKL